MAQHRHQDPETGQRRQGLAEQSPATGGGGRGEQAHQHDGCSDGKGRIGVPGQTAGDGMGQQGQGDAGRGQAQPAVRQFRGGQARITQHAQRRSTADQRERGQGQQSATKADPGGAAAGQRQAIGRIITGQMTAKQSMLQAQTAVLADLKRAGVKL